MLDFKFLYIVVDVCGYVYNFFILLYSGYQPLLFITLWIIVCVKSRVYISLF